jgi:ACS family hexuronate transporter-like MFS transporter
MNPTLSNSPPGTVSAAIGKYRWTICSLVFFATTINYLDRAVISLLKPYLETAFHWNSGDYANIEIAFKLAYSIGMVGVGRIIDKLGTKIGYALSTTLWSIAAMGHAIVSSTLGFGIARGFLGITEAGNFQDHGRVVSTARTGAGHGHFQLGSQRRRHHRPAFGTVYC